MGSRDCKPPYAGSNTRVYHRLVLAVEGRFVRQGIVMGPDHLIKKELARSKAPSNIAAELTAISAAYQEAKLVPPESLAMNSSASTFAAQVPRLGGLDGGQRLAALFLAMFGFPSAMDATPRTVPRVYQQAHDAALAKTPSTADGPTAPTPDRAGRLEM